MCGVKSDSMQWMRGHVSRWDLDLSLCVCLSHCVPLILRRLSLNYILTRPPVSAALTVVMRATAAMATAGIPSPGQRSAASSNVEAAQTHSRTYRECKPYQPITNVISQYFLYLVKKIFKFLCETFGFAGEWKKV